MTYFEDVENFHLLFEELSRSPRLLTDSEWTFRMKLILEELSETAEAMARRDLFGFTDGLADLVYVILGTAVKAGIPFDAIWQEVHAANMRKGGGGLDSSGKVRKPLGWTPPDIARVLGDSHR